MILAPRSKRRVVKETGVTFADPRHPDGVSEVLGWSLWHETEFSRRNVVPKSGGVALVAITC